MGRIPVLECLRAGRRRPLRLHVLASARGLDDILTAAHGVPVVQADRAELDRLADGAVHQGVVLHAGPLPLHDLDRWLDRFNARDAFVVLLDSVEDTHNFGAIVRTAAACGAAAVVFARDRAAPLSPAAFKAAAGAMEHVDLVQVTNISRAVQTLQKSGFWVAAMDADAEKTLWEADLLGRMALVIGNEGDGIRRLVRERCDYALSIPLTGAISSLNASVSAGIALAECRGQRWLRDRAAGK